MARFLKKSGEKYLYPWTEALSKRRDMFEVADPNELKELPDRISLDARHEEVLSLTDKGELAAFAKKHGLKLAGKATSVKGLQKEIRQALDAKDADEDAADEDAGTVGADDEAPV